MIKCDIDWMRWKYSTWILFDKYSSKTIESKITKS